MQLANVEREIDLQNHIRLIWRQKFFIIMLVVIFMIATAFVNYFVMKPTYEASASIMVNVKDTKPPEIKNSVDDLLNTLSQYPEMTMQSYVEQVRNPYVIQKVMDRLGPDVSGYTIEGLLKNVSIQTVRDTNIITIKLRGNDPEIVAKILNMWCEEFGFFVSNNTKARIGKSGQYLSEQLKIEEKQLNQVVEEMKAYLKQPKGATELSEEITSRLKQLTEFKIRYDELEVNIKSGESSLQQATRQLGKTPKVLVTDKTLSDDAFLQSVVEQKKNLSSVDAGQIKLRTEEINPVYSELEQKVANDTVELSKLIAEKNAVMAKIKESQRTLEDLQGLYAERKSEQDRLEEKLKKAQETYNQFSAKYEEARITSSAQIGEAYTTLLGPVFVPENPVGPQKLLNIIVSGMLGIIIGIGLVFVRNILGQTKKSWNVTNGNMN